MIQEDRFTIAAFLCATATRMTLAISSESLMRRHLDRDRLALMRVPDGPIRKELAEGRRATLPMEGLSTCRRSRTARSGSKLVVIGDAGTTDGLDAVVGDADLLVIERHSSAGCGNCPQLRPSDGGPGSIARGDQQRGAAYSTHISALPG